MGRQPIGLALLAVLLALAGCSREPDFDARYDAASEKIRAQAAAIDAEIEGTAPPSDAAFEDSPAR